MASQSRSLPRSFQLCCSNAASKFPHYESLSLGTWSSYPGPGCFNSASHTWTLDNTRTRYPTLGRHFHEPHPPVARPTLVANSICSAPRIDALFPIYPDGTSPFFALLALKATTSRDAAQLGRDQTQDNCMPMPAGARYGTPLFSMPGHDHARLLHSWIRSPKTLNAPSCRPPFSCRHTFDTRCCFNLTTLDQGASHAFSHDFFALVGLWLLLTNTLSWLSPGPASLPVLR